MPRALRARSACRSSSSASTLGDRRATSRRRPATRATRSPSGGRGRLRGRRTPPPTRRRPCSTGWPSRPARARCTGWRPGAGGSCGRCSVRPARRCATTCACARARLARGPLQRGPPLRPRARAPRPAGGAALDRPRGRSGRSPRPRASCARRRRCSTRRSTPRSSGSAAGRPCPLASCCASCPAVRRLVLRRLAEQAGGELAPVRPRRSSRSAAAGRSRSTSAAACARWSSTARSASRARPSAAVARSGRAAGARPRSLRGLGGRGRARRRRRRQRVRPDARCPLTVRGWRDGDRMRPVGLGGTKTLQDLFTDRKVPARAAPHAAGGGERPARSSGWPASRSTSASRPREGAPTRSG